MNRRSVSGTMLTLLLIGISSFTVFITPTYACPTEVTVEPLILWDTSLVPGTQFSIDIVVHDVENLWAYQFWLSFNPEVIHGVSVENGPFLGSAGGPVWVSPGAEFDNENGWLTLFGACILYFPFPPPDTLLPDGGGVLATVTFEVVGYGCAPITLEPETGLMNKYGEWKIAYEYCYGWEYIPPDPPEPGKWIPYERWLSVLTEGSGYFSNEPGPELYVRRRGAHGTSGVWPEWHVGLDDWTQTLYCRILNYGEVGAWVEVEFVVHNDLDGIERYWSSQIWVDAATWIDDDIVPGEVTVSASFTPGICGKYYASAILYFKFGDMVKKVPYYLTEDTLGGEGISRDIKVGFKVQEHL